VSIIIPTYNRARTIGRAIDSVIRQNYHNTEIIVVDDGSTDDTHEILERYGQRLRVWKHDKNKGATAAKNSGLNQIRGEWFTILDSDDEIEPFAIDTMMRMPLSINPDITAVTCNCLDTTTGEYSGKGLQEDQYLDVKLLMTVCKGEFWGLTKTSLLGDDRFNEKVEGLESILWYKINEKAKRYYIHAPLRIYHTEGKDRIMKARYNFWKEVAFYENLINEKHFWNQIKTYQPGRYFLLCRNGVIVMTASDKKELALRYYQLSREIARSSLIDLSYKYKIVSSALARFKALKLSIKTYLKKN
jgi:glycosyltransferase involved in cell wall biosynthesis